MRQSLNTATPVRTRNRARGRSVAPAQVKKMSASRAVISSVLFWSVSLLIFLVAQNQRSTGLSTASLALLLAFSSYMTWRDRGRSFPLFIFTLCFTLFLAGRQITNTALGTPQNEQGVLGTGAFSTDTLLNVNFALFVAATGVLIGWIFNAVRTDASTTTPPDPGKQKEHPSREHQISSLQRATAFLFLLCAAPQIYLYWKTAQTVADMGFFTGRLTAASGPLPLKVASGLYEFSFLAFLSLRPPPRITATLAGIYTSISAISLITLSRSDFMLTIGLLCIYFYYRQRNYGERWFKTGTVTLTLLAAPFVIALMNSLGSQRGRSLDSSTGTFAPVVDFVRSQGVSAHVIAATYDLSGRLPERHTYSVGVFADTFQALLATLTSHNRPLLTGQTAYRALEGSQYSHTISYLIAPFDYIRGIGYGSSYVAELLADFGILGVLTGSIAYGFALSSFYRYMQRGALAVFCCLFTAKGFLFAPRASFVQPIADLVSLPSLVALAVLALVIATTYTITARPQQSSSRRGGSGRNTRRSRGSYV